MAPMMESSESEKNRIASKMYKIYLEESKAKGERMNILVNTSNPIVNTVAGVEPTSPLYSHCYAHENKLIFDPYGYLYTCLVSVGKIPLSVGRYYPSVEYKENSILNRNIDNIPECRECVYSLLCGGGCPLQLTDYIDVFKPSCVSVKAEVHHLLPKYYNIIKEKG